MKVFSFTLVLAVVMLSGCASEDCAKVSETTSDSWLGDWLLVERGYSPGAGYIVDPVPSSPAQVLTLRTNCTMTSSAEALRDYQYYRIFDDPYSESPVIAFFSSTPDDAITLEDCDVSYNIVWEDDLMKLWYLYCFEGCHLGFRLAGSPCAFGG